MPRCRQPSKRAPEGPLWLNATLGRFAGFDWSQEVVQLVFASQRVLVDHIGVAGSITFRQVVHEIKHEFIDDRS